MSTTILHVAIDKPVYHDFDYLLPLGNIPNTQQLSPGIRLLVPFGKKQLVGILLAVNETPCLPSISLKPAIAFLDTNPYLTPTAFSLAQWASQYYHHPIGEVVWHAFPTLLKRPPAEKIKFLCELTALGKSAKQETLSRSPKQAALLNFLQQHPKGIYLDKIKSEGFSAIQIQALVHRNWLVMHPASSFLTQSFSNKRSFQHRSSEKALTLNEEQFSAVTQILSTQGFQTFLLHGITGSGKTEVYLHVIDFYLQQGKQALVLVPEISLTPQTMSRFERRFSVPIVSLHSGLSASKRRDAWLQAQTGEARIIIGTRSAVWAPYKNLGVIVLDEEHDPSFKQTSYFRYSARDVAVMRASMEHIPIILGTATPSLETLHNAHRKRFHFIHLLKRAGEASLPTFHIIDLRGHSIRHGISQDLLTMIGQHLEQNGQIVLFLNRRGYAPIFLCHACGWSASCDQCDARLTFHSGATVLTCHHCDTRYPVPRVCAQCETSGLCPTGIGTERVEQGLRELFPGVEIIRIDRDTFEFSASPSSEALFSRIAAGQKQILIGTQMIAKGHHFPNVTLVGILDADQALYSIDFRAMERLGQLILQVAGRAGRGEKPGHVYLQTHQPENPYLNILIQQGYLSFAETLLTERKAASWPPFSYLALLRAEAKKEEAPLDFLVQVKKHIEKHIPEVDLLGPIPTLMARKAGYYRASLLFRTTSRAILQKQIKLLIAQLSRELKKKNIRWFLDIDPIETNG